MVVAILKRSKNLFLVAAAALIIAAPLFALLPAKPTAAAVPDGWINRWAINFEGKIWIDNNPYDGVFEFLAPTRTDGCPRDKIVFNSSVGLGALYYNNQTSGAGARPAGASPSVVSTWVPSASSISSGCAETARNGLTINNADNRRITMYKTADDKVVSMHNGVTFTRVGEAFGSPLYAKVGDGDTTCRDLIIQRASASLNGASWFGGSRVGGSWTLYAVRDHPAGAARPDKVSETYQNLNPAGTTLCSIDFAGGEYTDANETGYGLTGRVDPGGELVVNGFDTAGNPAGSDGRDDAFAAFVGTTDNLTPGTGPGSGGGANPNACLIPGLGHLTSTDPGCKADAPQVCTVGETGLSSALAWIICPVTAMIADVTLFVEKNLIIPYLTVNPLKMTDASGNQTVVYKLWDSFRSIANVLFIIVFFIIIFATASGNFNYGIKRLLPRFFIVAIGANLIFFGAALAIDAFNIFGRGVESLAASTILQPLQNDPKFANAYPEGPSTSHTVFVLGAALLAGIALTGGAALGWLFGLLVAAVVIIFVAVIVLILRQMLILALVIVSPLAMVAWLLPNTEKYATKWFNLLLQLLMMYPLIVMLFAAGKIMGTLFASPETAIIVAPGGETSTTLTDTVRVGIMFLSFVIPIGLLPFVFMATSSLMGKAYGAMRNAASKSGKAIGDSDAMKNLKGRLANTAALNPTLGKLGGTKTGRFALGALGYGQTRRRKVINASAAFASQRNKDIQAEFEAAGISGDKVRLQKIAIDEKGPRSQAAIQQLAQLGAGDQLHEVKKAVIQRNGANYATSAEYKNFNNTVAREGSKALAKTPDLLDMGSAAAEYSDPKTIGKMQIDKLLDLSPETIRRWANQGGAHEAAIRAAVHKARFDPNLNKKFSADQMQAFTYSKPAGPPGSPPPPVYGGGTLWI